MILTCGCIWRHESRFECQPARFERQCRAIEIGRRVGCWFWL